LANDGGVHSLSKKSPKTDHVFTSLFSMGVPVKPMNEAFGSASRMWRANSISS
jgi:hypothetical protein